MIFWSEKTKSFLLIVMILAVLAAAVFFGARFADSFYYQKGLAAYKENRYEEAKKNFSIALKFNWRDPITYFMLGRVALGVSDLSSDIYYPNADYKQTITRQEKAIKLGLLKSSPRSYLQALDDLGISYWYLGNYDKSTEYYLKLIELYPEYSFWPRFLVAEHYFERVNKPKEALENLKTAITLEQANFEYNQERLYRFYSLIARLYLYFEDFNNTEKYAKLAIENAGMKDDIESQVAHNIIALVAGHEKDFSKAESEIRKSNSLANSYNAHNCVLSGAYYRGDNYQKTISIAKAVEKTETYIYSVCLAYLGDAYLALKNFPEAKKYYQEYLALTDVLPSRNIFVERNLRLFAKELERISQ